MKHKFAADEVLRRYVDEGIPEFMGIPLLDVNQKGGFGNTPLNLACTRGSLDEVAALLEGGADPNSKGEHGCTPLHDAVGQGHLEVVRLLLQSGASPDARNDLGLTARDRAAQRKLSDIVSLFDGQ